MKRQTAVFVVGFVSSVDNAPFDVLTSVRVSLDLSFRLPGDFKTEDTAFSVSASYMLLLVIAIARPNAFFHMRIKIAFISA